MEGQTGNVNIQIVNSSLLPCGMDLLAQALLLESSEIFVVVQSKDLP